MLYVSAGQNAIGTSWDIA